MVHRLRDSQFCPSATYDSVEKFTSEARSAGTHAIEIGGQFLDILIEDRKSETTLVVFHGALSETERLVPVFHGRRAADMAGVNLVAVADPSLTMGDVDISWFIGNRAIGKLEQYLVPILRHRIRSLRGSRTILMGGSGGGYAALSYAEHFPGSTVLIMNPRLNLLELPFAKVDRYLRVCHGAFSETPRARIRRDFVVDDLATALPTPLPFKLLILQNLGDKEFLEFQVRPFLDARGGDPSLYVRYGSWGEGHTAVPSATVQDVVWRLSAWGSVEENIERAGFGLATETLAPRPD